MSCPTNVLNTVINPFKVLLIHFHFPSKKQLSESIWGQQGKCSLCKQSFSKLWEGCMWFLWDTSQQILLIQSIVLVVTFPLLTYYYLWKFQAGTPTLRQRAQNFTFLCALMLYLCYIITCHDHTGISQKSWSVGSCSQQIAFYSCSCAKHLTC